jgi:hypothetical protein
MILGDRLHRRPTIADGDGIPGPDLGLVGLWPWLRFLCIATSPTMARGGFPGLVPQHKDAKGSCPGHGSVDLLLRRMVSMASWGGTNASENRAPDSGHGG